MLAEFGEFVDVQRTILVGVEESKGLFWAEFLRFHGISNLSE